MPDVTINGRKVTIEKFRLSKATRVITLLRILRQQVPEISRELNEFQREYAAEYATKLPRLDAIARFGLGHVSEEEWERAGHEFTVPGKPAPWELFFHMGPLVYERAEEVTLRLLGLVAMDNETVARYVKDDDIWTRVDEFVDEVIRDAPLDDIMDLVAAAAEVIDGQVLQKAKTLRDQAGNLAGLLGWKTTTTSPVSPESSEQPETSSSTTSTGSPSDTGGTPTESELSPGTTSERSVTASTVTA
jgi:hypothetical protein